MKKKSRYILPIIFSSIGVIVILFVLAFGVFSRASQNSAIGTYSSISTQEEKDIAADNINRALDYNETISDMHAGFANPSATNTLNEYDKIFAENNGMIGVLNIEDIDLRLPIYHGTEEEVLMKGVGHVPDSAFPLDSFGSKAFLTGHNGLPGADMLFTRLDEVQEDDEFSIRMGMYEYHYEVTKIYDWMTPEEAEVYAQKQNDLDSPAEVVLMTCTPLGVNSHRFLVIGSYTHRTIVQEDEPVKKASLISFGKVTYILLALLAASSGLLIRAIQLHRKEVANEQ